jgi:hypothetical protein
MVLQAAAEILDLLHTQEEITMKGKTMTNNKGNCIAHYQLTLGYSGCALTGDAELHRHKYNEFFSSDA